MAADMRCTRCGQPTIFRSLICKWCQEAEQREADRLIDRFADTLTERRLRHEAREGK